MLGLLLAATMTFSFSACNGDADTANGTNDEGNRIVEDANDYVYVPEAFPLEELEFVNAACQSKDGLYLVSPFFEEETFTAGAQGYYLNAAGELTKLALRTENREDTTVSVEVLGELSDGSLVYIESEKIFNSGNLKPTGQHFFLVHALAEDGEEISRADITEQLQFKQGNDAILSFLTVDKEDQIYVSEGKNIWVFDLNGELVYKAATDAGSWIQDMGATKEGQVVYSGWDSAAGGKSLFVIDETSGMVTSCTENVPEVAGFCGCIIPGAEKGIVVNTIEGLVKYDIETQTGVPILKWADSGLRPDAVAAFTLLEDGNILAVVEEESTESQGTFSYQAVLLRKTPASEVEKQEREIVTLGVFWDNKELLRAVTDFNISQEAYQIEVINYGESGDSDAAITRFINELIAGTGPDVFEPSGIDIRQLARKGVLEELTPYLEKDTELKKENYFESVLNAYAVDGSLYTIPSSFNVFGMAGKNAYLAPYGEDYGWTLEEVLNLAEEHPEKEIYGYGFKNHVLLSCLGFNYDQFIDWESGECYLDSEAFIQLLEFADTFKDQYDGENNYSITDKILDGTLMADETSLSSIQDYQRLQALFGEDFILKGFPTENGTGLAVRGSNMLVINAGSGHKEGAWAFMRSLLTEQYYEKESVMGFPTLVSAYNRINEEYMTPDYTLDENGNRIEASKGSYSEGNFSVKFRTSTEEEAEWITDVIEHCDRVYLYDSQIINIISEEAAAFFEGQKSAEETAEIIQNRVKVYVNENM